MRISDWSSDVCSSDLLRLKPQEANRHLDNAMEGANRAAALTRRLLAFARSEPLLPSAVDPDALVAGLSDLIDRSIGDQITMAFENEAKGWRIFVDQHQKIGRASCTERVCPLVEISVVSVSVKKKQN